MFNFSLTIFLCYLVYDMTYICIFIFYYCVGSIENLQCQYITSAFFVELFLLKDKTTDLVNGISPATVDTRNNESDFKVFMFLIKREAGCHLIFKTTKPRRIV